LHGIAYPSGDDSLVYLISFCTSGCSALSAHFTPFPLRDSTSFRQIWDGEHTKPTLVILGKDGFFAYGIGVQVGQDGGALHSLLLSDGDMRRIAWCFRVRRLGLYIDVMPAAHFVLALVDRKMVMQCNCV